MASAPRKTWIKAALILLTAMALVPFLDKFDTLTTPPVKKVFSPEEGRAFHRRMTLSTWNAGGDLMRYVFLNMPEFFRHGVIRRSGDPSRLPAFRRDDLENASVRSALGTMPLHRYVAAAPINAMLVLHQGHIVFEAYPRMRASDRHLITGISKTFAATLIALMADRGDIDLARGVDAYIPELKGTGWEGIAIRDILDMTSGINCLEYEDGATSDPNTCYYRFEASLDRLHRTDDTPASTFHLLKGLVPDKPPGQVFDYTSGKKYNELIGDAIWSAIGAEHDALIAMSRDGIPVAHGGISATLRDLGRYGLLFTPSFMTVTDRPIVSDDYLMGIMAGGRPRIYDQGPHGLRLIAQLAGERPRHNAWQWDAVMEDGDFYKAGYGGQGIYISPAKDLVIAWFGTHTKTMETNDMFPVSRQLALSGLFAPETPISAPDGSAKSHEPVLPDPGAGHQTK